MTERAGCGGAPRVLAVLVIVALLGAAACTGDDGSTGASDDARTHVVVDTDLGGDDVMALLYLLRRDDVAIDAVTVAGDGLAHCDPGVDNARAILTLGGSPDTPVACGPRTPLAGDRAFPEEWRSFSDDLRALGLPTPPPEAAGASAASAPDLLRETLAEDVALLTLGPFTNVAAALRAEPALADRVRSVTSMAGAVGVPGNAPGGLAEYNVWVDPVAAKEVLGALPVTLVPLDATNRVPATPFFLDALAAHASTPEAEAVDTLLRGNPQVASGASFFWDPLAAALLVEPSLATIEDGRVMLDTSDTLTGGWMSSWDEGVPVRIATDPDALGFEREYLSVLTGQEVRSVRPEPDVVAAFDGDRCTVDGPTRVRAGPLVLAFDGPSRGGAVAAVGMLEGRSYASFVRALRAPGSLITEEPRGVVVVGALDASLGSPAMARFDLEPGDAFVVCATPEDEGLRVWPGGHLRVTRG